MRKTLLSFMTIVLLAGCSGSDKKPAEKKESEPGMVSALAKMGNLAVDPFTQMSMTFDGNPTPDEIHEKMDQVLTMYGVELTNPNRSLAGKTLTALHGEMGHSEMSILENMLHAPTNGEKFDEAARRVSSSMN